MGSVAKLREGVRTDRGPVLVTLCASACHSMLSMNQLSTLLVPPLDPPQHTHAHWAIWMQKVGAAEVVQPRPQASGPLAGTVGGLLHCVRHPGGIAGTEELHGAPLQAHLTAALAEASIGVDVVVVDAGGWTSPITGH